VQESTRDIHDELREKDRAREASIKRIRLLIRVCGDGIRSLHRGDGEGVARAISDAKDHLNGIREGLKDHPDLATSNSVIAGLTEYTELIVVSGLILGDGMPTYREVGVPPAAYLNGLGDAIGEIRRHILNLLRRRETAQAERYLEIVEEMYDIIMNFDYPRAILGDLRRKQDVARSLLERTRADVTMAVLQKDLSERLEGSME
jgi:translin